MECSIVYTSILIWMQLLSLIMNIQLVVVDPKLFNKLIAINFMETCNQAST